MPFFFFFNVFVHFYRFYRYRIRQKFLKQTKEFLSSSLQTDKVPELRSELSVTSGGDISSPSFNSNNRHRGSIAFTEGFEKNLHVLAKDQYPDRAMGIFTSGGDAQGMPSFLFE